MVKKMEKINYKVKSSSGVMLDVKYYKAEISKGILQICHGMQEHKERYDNFAKFLVDNGYDVLIHDHLGHGKSINEEHPLGDLVSAKNLIEDIDMVRQSVDVKGSYFILGHSMGSFLARIYSSRQKVDRLIACGTGQPSTIQAKLLEGILLTQKRDIPLDSIQRLVMNPLEKEFDNPMDWISINKKNQIEYENDPLCGKSFTRSGYKSLMDIVLTLNNDDTFKNCSANKILLISGERDPLGNFTKDILKIEKRYKEEGKDVKTIFYENMSHEILNEVENQKVYNDILDFLKS